MEAVEPLPPMSKTSRSASSRVSSRSLLSE